MTELDEGASEETPAFQLHLRSRTNFSSPAQIVLLPQLRMGNWDLIEPVSHYNMLMLLRGKRVCLSNAAAADDDSDEHLTYFSLPTYRPRRFDRPLRAEPAECSWICTAVCNLLGYEVLIFRIACTWYWLISVSSDSLHTKLRSCLVRVDKLYSGRVRHGNLHLRGASVFRIINYETYRREDE